MGLHESPRMGGKSLLRIILPASRNLVDALLSHDEGGSHVEEGLGDLVRQTHGRAFRLEVTLVDALRSDVLLQQLEGKPSPPSLVDLGIGPPKISLPDPKADVMVLVIEPDVTHGDVWMHRQSGYLLELPQIVASSLSPEQKRELEQQWIPIGLLDTNISAENFRHIVRILKHQASVHVIGFNGSTLDPNDCTYNYYDTGETTSVRIRKLNLSLLDLSIEEGISIVDVDRMVAEVGGEGNVEGAFRYSSDVRRVIRRELLRVMEDIGFFDKRPLLQQVGQGNRA